MCSQLWNQLEMARIHKISISLFGLSVLSARVQCIISVAASISCLSQHLGPEVETCAIIPAAYSHVSQSAYERFVQQLERQLKDLPLPVVHSGRTMAQSASETMYLTYDDIIQSYRWHPLEPLSLNNHYQKQPFRICHQMPHET